MDGKASKTEHSDKRITYLDNIVNLIRFSVLIVDENMNIAWSNQAANRLLEVGDILCQTGNQLRSANGKESKRLKKFLLDVINGDIANPRGSVISLRCLNSGRFCELVASRVQMADISPLERQIPTAVLIVSDPEQKMTVPPSILKSLFGLTASESGLAKAMLNGLSLDEYAHERQISVNTVRTHLKSIFRKTESSSQAGLVTLLSRLVPPVEFENEDS